MKEWIAVPDYAYPVSCVSRFTVEVHTDGRIKQQQDKQPHYRGNLAGPRRSNQKAGLMKDRVDRLAQGKNQAVGPPAGAVAAAIPTSTQRRPRLPQKLPSDILTLQSKGHLNLVATTTIGAAGIGRNVNGSKVPRPNDHYRRK